MKTVYVLLGLVFAIPSMFIYMRAILRHEIQPHPFSWLIWGVTSGVAGIAQLFSGGGVASWLTIMGALYNLCIVGFGFRTKRGSITMGDWGVFAVALLAIPLWIITHQPLWSVILVAFIDTTGYVPTFRKSWNNPEKESAGAFFVWGMATAFTLLALDSYALVNWLYLATQLTANMVLACLIWLRRRALVTIN